MAHQAPPNVLAELLESEPAAQRSFAWSPGPWRAQMHDLPDVLEVIDELPDAVDRHSTRDVVLAELEAGRVLSAFVPAMIWGYGTVGYGPTRVRWVLTGNKSTEAVSAPVLPSVSDRLAAGAQKVRENGPREAFYLMNNEGRIKHLRASFFTKWLYFASALSGPDDPAAAPILDRQVATWLADNADASLQLNDTNSYSAYLDLLSTWGEQYGRTPVQVEKAIFGLATGRD